MYGYTEAMLNYTEDGAEALCSEYAAGGSSAFEDEAYGDVSLARSDNQPHFGCKNMSHRLHMLKNTVWFRRLEQ